MKAYLGEGGTLSLLENVQKLFQRHIQHTNEQCRVANNILVCSLSYTGSSPSVIMNIIDKYAKKLSAHTYKNHRKVQKTLTFVGSIQVRNGRIIYKTVCSKSRSQLTYSWSENERCPCKRSHNLNFQCEHELKLDVRFIAEKFSTRWL